GTSSTTSMPCCTIPSTASATPPTSSANCRASPLSAAQLLLRIVITRSRQRPRDLLLIFSVILSGGGASTPESKDLLFAPNMATPLEAPASRTGKRVEAPAFNRGPRRAPLLRVTGWVRPGTKTARPARLPLCRRPAHSRARRSAQKKLWVPHPCRPPRRTTGWEP